MVKDKDREIGKESEEVVSSVVEESMNFSDLNILSHTLFIREENFPHIEHDVQLYLSRYYCLFSLLYSLSLAIALFRASILF